MTVLYPTTMTVITVTAASTPLVAQNSSRRMLSWMNIGANDVTVSPGPAAAVFGQGFIYQGNGANKQGGAQQFDAGQGTSGLNGSVPADGFNAVCNTGLSTTVVVWER